MKISDLILKLIKATKNNQLVDIRHNGNIIMKLKSINYNYNSGIGKCVLELYQ